MHEHGLRATCSQHFCRNTYQMASHQTAYAAMEDASVNSCSVCGAHSSESWWDHRPNGGYLCTVCSRHFSKEAMDSSHTADSDSSHTSESDMEDVAFRCSVCGGSQPKHSWWEECNKIWICTGCLRLAHREARKETKSKWGNDWLPINLYNELMRDNNDEYKRATHAISELSNNAVTDEDAVTDEEPEYVPWGYFEW